MEEEALVNIYNTFCSTFLSLEDRPIFLDVLDHHSVLDVEEINEYLLSKYPSSLDTMNVMVSESDL